MTITRGCSKSGEIFISIYLFIYCSGFFIFGRGGSLRSQDDFDRDIVATFFWVCHVKHQHEGSQLLSSCCALSSVQAHIAHIPHWLTKRVCVCVCVSVCERVWHMRVHPSLSFSPILFPHSLTQCWPAWVSVCVFSVGHIVKPMTELII